MSYATLTQDRASVGSIAAGSLAVSVDEVSVTVQLGLRGVDGRDGSAPPWGDIIGNIDDQLDLKARLDAKIGVDDIIEGGNF